MADSVSLQVRTAHGDWLREYNEAPWRKFIRSLDEKGCLLVVDGVMVDAKAMFRTRFECDSNTCASLTRRGKTESCCMEYDVEITPEEHGRIMAHAAEVIEFLAENDSGRVKADRSINSLFKIDHAIHLVKEKKRCGFSFRDPKGRLWCGLHGLALKKGIPVDSIKPVACILFPLVTFRFENGDMLLTALSTDTEPLFDASDSNHLPCLRNPRGPLMFEFCRSGVELAFGREFYQRLTEAAESFLARA